MRRSKVSTQSSSARFPRRDAPPVPDKNKGKGPGGKEGKGGKGGTTTKDIVEVDQDEEKMDQVKSLETNQETKEDTSTNNNFNNPVNNNNSFNNNQDEDFEANYEEKSSEKKEIKPPEPVFEMRPLKVYFSLPFEGIAAVTASNNQGYSKRFELSRANPFITYSSIEVPLGKVKFQFFYKAINSSFESSEYNDDSDLREFFIDDNLPFIAIVLNEHLTIRGRVKVPREQYLRACLRLMQFLAIEYLKSDFVFFSYKLALSTFIQGNPVYELTYSTQSYWEFLNSNEISPEELFIRRILFLEKLSQYLGKLTVTNLSSVITQYDATKVLNHCLAHQFLINPIKIFLIDILRTYNYVNIRPNPQIIPWILLMLNISPENPIASNLLTTYSHLIHNYLSDLIPLLNEDLASKIMKCFCSVDALKSFILHSQSLLFQEQGIFSSVITQHSLLSKFVKSILASPKYTKPTTPDDHRTEFEAIKYFAMNDLELLKDLLRYTDCKSFNISSIIIEPLENLFNQTVLFVLESNIEIELKQKRVLEFKRFAERSNIPNISFSVYKILDDLIKRGYTDLYFIQSIHSLLPTIWEAGLDQRLLAFSGELSRELEKIEIKSLGDVCSLDINDPIVIRSYILKTIFPQSNHFGRFTKILASTWNRAIKKEKITILSRNDEKKIMEIILPNYEQKDENNLTIQSLSSDRIRDLFFSLTKEIQNHPFLLHDDEYIKINNLIRETYQNLELLAEAITTMNLLSSSLDILLTNKFLVTNISYFITKFDPETLSQCQNKRKRIRAEWEDLYVAFRDYMPQHPRFKKCSEELSHQTKEKILEMLQMPIKLWISPTNLNQSLRELAENLRQAQYSSIYISIWHKQCQEDNNIEVSNDPDQALDQWKNCIDKSFNDWKKMIQSIFLRNLNYKILKEILFTIIEDDPPSPDIPTIEVQARDTTLRYNRQVNEHRRQRVHNEVDVTFHVLPGIFNIDKVKFEEIIFDFISSLAFYREAKNILTLCYELKCPVENDNPFPKYLQVFENDTSTIGEIIDVFHQIKGRYPKSLEIVFNFPSVLLSLIQDNGTKGGLLPLFRGLKDRALLNQIVDRKIAEVDPAAHVLLVGLQEARDAFDVTLHNIDCFTCFITQSIPNFTLLCEYLSSIGWCISITRKLVNGIDSLFGLLYDGVSGTSTITQVYALQNTGEFLITLPDGKLTATYIDSDKKKIELSSEKLEDIPFQLCLTGSTIETINDNEMGIHNKQKLFLEFMELIKSLRDILYKLSVSGHPSYQNSKLIIGGSESIENLTEMLEEEKNTYYDWQDFLIEVDHTLPLLTCLSRNQLVNSLRIISNNVDPFQLIELLKTVCPLINDDIAEEITIKFITNPQFSHDDLTCFELAYQIHEILIDLSDYLFPLNNQCNTNIELAINTFKGKIIEKKLLEYNSVMVLQLPYEDSKRQVDALCALYITRLKRLPVSIEVLTCTKDTTELQASDFIRRWIASTTFVDKYLNNQSCMFCMVNSEQLKPNIQNIILSKIHAFKQKSKIPLVIIASPQNESDSILCSGLRSDWIKGNNNFVRECSSLFKTYFPIIFPGVYVYSSEHPSSGKTSSILHNHVIQPSQNDTISIGQIPYTRLPLNGNINEAVDILTCMENNRKLHNCHDIVIHFNISNTLDVDLLNNFFLNFIILGIISNSKGDCYVRNINDTIVFEWPSEGILAYEARNNCLLSTSFNLGVVNLAIHFSEFRFRPCSENDVNCIINYVDEIYNPNLKVGTQMMIAYFNCSPGSFTMPFSSKISSIIVPEPKELYNLILRYLTTPYSPPHLPAVVYRFYKFFTNQLLGLFNWNYYKIVTQEQEDIDTNDDELLPACHSKYYRRLAYHFARCSYRLALDLASEAIPTLTEEYKDNDTRHENLIFTFTNLKNQNFLIFSEANMPEMVSISGNIFLNEITRDDNDHIFQEFIKLQYNREYNKPIQSICNQLSDKNYDPVKDISNNHAIERLLVMLGDKENFGVLIFNTLKLIAGTNCPPNLSSDQPIQNISEEALYELENVIIQDGHMTNNNNNNNNNIGSLFAPNKRVLDFINRAIKWMRHICGSYTSQTPPFILTVDNIVRLLAIKLRLACKIPVVLIGETGSGKTHLISFYSRISGCFFEVINIHGGMTPQELLNRIFEIIHSAKQRKVIILLDEVNSMPSVWTIKELVCERFILGRHIPDNVRFICIMNPRRRRKTTLELGGLDYSPYQSNKVIESLKNVKKLPPLVYEVHRSPESLMSLIWDFGNPCESQMILNDAYNITHGRTPFPKDWNYVSDEIIFAESMIHWLIISQLGNFDNGIEVDGINHPLGLSVDFRKCDKAENEGVLHYKFLRSLFCVLTKVSQDFLRDNECFDDVSAASLRDIARTVNLIPFIMTVQQRFLQLEPSMANHSQYLYFKFLEVAIHVSFVLNYSLRLGTSQRSNYYSKLQTNWDMIRNQYKDSISIHFLPVPLVSSHIYQSFDEFATQLCGYLALEDGMAINEALKENITSLFCSIMGNQDTGIAQFIVGRPGSTKSSSLDILCASTDPNSTDNRCRFFRTENWFQIRKFVLQCTPTTTADDIMRVARSAANYQSIYPRCRCVIVLEEVGLTVGSEYNPLMVLHGLVDRGVLLENGKYIRLPIVGISNWRLDASKMNRMRTTHRGNPSVNDLMLTANSIIRGRSVGGSAKFDVNAQNSLRNFAQIFYELVLNNQNGSSDDIKQLAWFYGMRDFYAFVQLLHMHHSIPLAKELGLQKAFIHNELDPHLVRWATKICFGGHPNSRLEEFLAKSINDSFFIESDQIAQVATWQRNNIIEGFIQDKYYCDMCCRIDFIADIKLNQNISDDPGEMRQYFSKHYSNVTSRNCLELDTLDKFSTLKILSYLLNIQHGKMTTFGRMRHVLLFTRANAALHLLRSLNIVKQEQAVIIFGRSEPTLHDILEDILRVRRTMLSGKILILVGAKHIYESMYDALNQHYTVEGEGENKRYYTRLTMNGYTASFPIHHSFRCIVIEQESTCKLLLPPFINRFAKCLLNYSSALSIQQKNLVRAIRDKSMILTDSNTKSDILKLLIPGYSIDTIDSLAFLIPTELLKDGPDFQNALQFCMKQLSYLCSPRRLKQLIVGMFEGFLNKTAQDMIQSWDIQRSHLLVEDINLLKDISPNKKDNFQHLFLLTEQRCLEYETLTLAIEEVFENSFDIIQKAIDINRITSDNEIIELLEKLKEYENEEYNSYCIAIFDTSYTNIADQLERFLYTVNSINLNNNIHIIIVGIVKNSSTPGILTDEFFLHLSSKWIYLFMDEIFPKSIEDEISLPQLLNYNIPLKEQTFSSIIKPDLFCYFVYCRSLSIAQRVKNKAIEIENLNEEISTTFTYCQNVSEAIAIRFCEQFKELTSLDKGEWIKLSLKKIRQTDSLRQQLVLFLSIFCERCILKYSTYLFSFNNFQFTLPKNEFNNIFSIIFKSRLIVPYHDLSTCYQVDLPVDIEWIPIESTNGMFEEKNTILKFPFSFLLYNTFKPIMKINGLDALNQKINDIFGNIERNQIIEQSYTDDIFYQMGILDETQLHVVYRLIQEFIGFEESLSIEKFHEILELKKNQIDAIIRLVTNPSIKIYIIYQCSDPSMISNSIIQSVLNQKGIINLEVIPDLILLMGNTYLIRLYQAIAIGVIRQSEEFQIQAGLFAQQCQEGYEVLLNEFMNLSNVALILCKFLLPVLLDVILPENLQDIVLNLLKFIFNNFNSFPLTVVSYLLSNTINYWLQTPNEDRILEILSDVIKHNGVKSLQSIQISRCIFDICLEKSIILAMINKINEINDKTLKNIILSGVITSILEILSTNLRYIVTNNEKEVFIEDDDAKFLSDIVQNQLLLNRSLVEESATFTLRILSEKAVEIDIAKKCLIHELQLIPQIIIESKIVKTFLTPVEEEPSIFGLFPDYYIGNSIITQINSSPNVNQVLIDQFLKLNEIGQILSILEHGFCKMSVGNNRNGFNILKQSLRNINGNGNGNGNGNINQLKRFTLILLETENNLLLNMNIELKRAWIFIIIHMLTINTPFMRYYSRMILTPNHINPFPQISPNEQNRISYNVCRFLHSAAAQASAILHPQGNINYAKVNEHCNKINEDILLIKCPSCKKAMDFWPGCFAVVCECNANFCGWCLKETNGDAHPHVLTCEMSLKPNDYFGTEEQYYQVRNKERIKNLQQYLNTRVEQDMRSAVLSSITPNLIQLNIPTDDFGVILTGYSLNLSLNRFETSGNMIKKLLFSGSLSDDPAYSWLNSLINLRISKVIKNCNNEGDIIRIISEEIISSGEPASFLDTFRGTLNEQMQDISPIGGILTWDENYELLINQLSINELKLRLPHHFAFRRRFTDGMFWQKVDENNELQLLKFLHQKEDSLKKENIYGMVNILNYIGDVVRICNKKQLTIKESETKTLGELAEENDFIGGQRLIEFCNDIEKIFPKVERYNCRGKESLQQAFGHLEFNEKILLKDIIPQITDLTIIPVMYRGVSPSDGPQVWQGLGIIQNDTVQMLQNMFQSPKLGIIKNLYNITIDDVITFDVARNIFDSLPLFLEPQSIPILSDDIWILQHQIIHNVGLWGKQILSEDLPEFLYNEDKKKSIFSKVRDKVEPKIPSVEMQNRLVKLVDQYYNFGPTCLEYLVILAMEASQRSTALTDYNLIAFGDSIDIPLTDEQRIGKEYLSSPILSRDLRIENLVPLCAILWNGSVINEATIPLDLDLTKQLEEELIELTKSNTQQIIIPYLFIGIRILGLQFLSISQTKAFLEAPFNFYLEDLVGDYLGEYLNDTILSTIPIQHFQSVFEISERILKKELSKINEENKLDVEFEVSLAVLQPPDRESYDIEPIQPTLKKTFSKNEERKVNYDEYQDYEHKEAPLQEQDLQEEEQQQEEQKQQEFKSRWEGRETKIVLGYPRVK